MIRRMRLSRYAYRTYVHTIENGWAIRYISRHPAELTRHLEWLRQRTAATMTMRMPWWPYDAVAWMTANISPDTCVFEYGGGGSTLWLADRDASVTTVEHDREWHRQLADSLPAAARLLFRPPTASGIITSAVAPGFFDDYATAIDEKPDASLDLVIVDGRARVECAHRAMPKVKPGGLLLLDDTDRARYQSAVDLLHGWERHVFTGLKPGQRSPAQTSVWRCPAD